MTADLEELRAIMRPHVDFARASGWTQLYDFEDLLNVDEQERFRELAKACGFDGTTQIDAVLGDG